MISGGKLNIFNRNDLMIKTDFELSKIAKREELLNRYAMYNKKDVLIDKILEHLNKKYKYIISKLNEDDKKLIDASFSIQRRFISLNTAMDKKISKENLENTIVQIFNILEFNNG